MEAVMRIVSLLPSATEIVFALGLGDQLVGRTHRCDYPAEVSDVPIVTSRRGPGSDDNGSDGGGMDGGSSSRQIHDRVSAARHSGSSLYRLDTEFLQKLQPDLVL
ncbi:MAG: hypothetical protein ACC726_10865, partial [Chloroflexota bacterium]